MSKCFAVCEENKIVEVIAKKGFKMYKVETRDNYNVGIKFDERLGGYPMVIPVSLTVGASAALVDVAHNSAMLRISSPTNTVAKFIVYVIDAGFSYGDYFDA